MVSFAVLSQFLIGSLNLTSLCEEGENQFRWLVENQGTKSKEFILRADDRAGYSYRGRIAPKSSLFVITYRKLKETRGADEWTLKSGKEVVSVARVRESCRLEQPPPPAEPPVCPPVPEAPPVPLRHPCLPATDGMQSVEPLTAFVKVRTDLSDTTRTFTYYEDIGFTLQTCEAISISGRFSQSSLRNTFTLNSQLILGSPAELGATRIALLASDGTVVSESSCDSINGCVLQPFLVKDLQGNFGLTSQSTFYIVVDYLIDGVSLQRAIVFTT